MSKQTDQDLDFVCCVANCKQPSVLTYYAEYPLCQDHWERLCGWRESGQYKNGSQIVDAFLKHHKMPKPPADAGDAEASAVVAEAQTEAMTQEKPTMAAKKSKQSVEYKAGQKTAAGAEIVSVEKNDNDKVHMLTIRCTHPGCKNTRRIHVQDAFQVKYCDQHRTKASRNGDGKASKANGAKGDKAKGAKGKRGKKAAAPAA